MSISEHEAWRPIPGYEGLYSVSSVGRVMSHTRTTMRRGRPLSIPGGIMKTPDSGTGYQHFNVRKDGRTRTLFVHQVVAWAFIGPQDRDHDARHLNGNSMDCRIENIAYGSRSRNISDAKEHGTFPVYERRPGAILTKTQAVEIAVSSESATILSARYGVKPSTIKQIRRGETWNAITVNSRKPNYRKRGEQVPGSKLTADDVRCIRASSLSNRKQAKRFGVDKGTIASIRNGKTWKHIEP